MKRTIIKIDEELCNGCGACVTGCHEGALQLINGKAVMISELFCDGLGACIGDCPVGAIELEEREAEPYSEIAVMERMAPKGEHVIKAHLKHLKEHGEDDLYNQGIAYLNANNISINMDKPSFKAEKLACGCPGSQARSFGPVSSPSPAKPVQSESQPSELRQFPVQLHLINPNAPFFAGSNFLLAADCAAFAYGDFHSKLLKGKRLAIACPKLDSNTQNYVDKLVTLINDAKIDTLSVVIMEVPCCNGLLKMAESARAQASRNIPIKLIVVSVQGELLREEWI